jgi:SAM-dependent methyltransferase
MPGPFSIPAIYPLKRWLLLLEVGLAIRIFPTIPPAFRNSPSQCAVTMSLIRRIRRSKPAQKSIYNALNWVMRKNKDLQTLNCGLVPKSGYRVGRKYGENSISRLGLELYHPVAQEFPNTLSEKRLLEMGCGGGAAYIADRFQPKSLVAIDFSTQSIRLCKGRYKADNLAFEIGDANDLRFKN